MTRDGHVGLRVVGPDPGQDRFHHWGRANYTSPLFLLDYLLGRATFHYERKPWAKALARYRREDRTVTAARLALSRPQLHALVRALDDNARPERRDYVYDQTLDNCATRVRDVIDAVTGGAVRAAAATLPTGPSYRDWALIHGAGSLTFQLGLDLLAGPHFDTPLNGWAAMFRPAALAPTFARATAALAADGVPAPLAGPSHVLYQRHGPPPLTGDRAHGRRLVLLLCGAMAALIALGGLAARRPGAAWAAAAGRASGLALVVAGLAFGLLGALLTVLALFSTMADYAWSYNALVFWPTDLVLVAAGGVWLVRGRPAAGRRLWRYAAVRLALLGALATAEAAGLTAPQDHGVYLLAAALVLGAVALTARLASPTPVEA